MDHDLELIIPYPGNIWKLDFYKLFASWKYWKLKSSTFSIILEILEIGFFQFSHIPEILDIGFYIFLIFWKCGRRAGGSMGCFVLPWFFGSLSLEFCDISNLRK